MSGSIAPCSLKPLTIKLPVSKENPGIQHFTSRSLSSNALNFLCKEGIYKEHRSYQSEKAERAEWDKDRRNKVVIQKVKAGGSDGVKEDFNRLPKNWV